MNNHRIAHIGIAVKDLDLGIQTFGKLLQAKPSHTEEVKEQKVKTAMFAMGESSIELLQATEVTSPIGKFIEKRGEGMHHVAVMVDDIESELVRLRKLGFQLIDERPRRGADNCLVAFLHPKSANGVLIELCQRIKLSS
jgi:methylmalonyl-CoA/ethylmalonyl-CoA epimerase